MEKGPGEISHRNLAKHMFKAFVDVPINKTIPELRERTEKDRITGLDSEHPLHDMILGLENRWEKDNTLRGSFVIADLSDLHGVNDFHGERAGGDDYLRAVASVFKTLARGEGRCFRDGKQADTFVLYLPGLKDRAELDSVLDRADVELKSQEKSYQHIYPDIRFGLSYCISSFDDEKGPTVAYTEAANRMGDAKKSAKGERVKDVGRIFI